MAETSVQDPPARLFPGFGALVASFAIAVSLVPLGLFVFSLLGRYFYFAELVGNFRCQIMLMLIPFAVIALGIRRWWLGGVILVALCWSMIGIVWVYLPGYQPPPGEQKLKVMSYNVLVANYRHAEVVQQIREADPDVIAILEYSSQWHEALECLEERYPHNIRVPRWHGFGLALFSKYPLTDTEVVQLTENKTDNPMVVASVNFGSQTIRLAAVHVFSPTNRNRLELRNQQFEDAALTLAKSKVPTVIMGDFNCTPWSPFLADFLQKTGYRDSRVGFGYQATWHAQFWPLRIPIDHAFVSDEIHVHRRQVGGEGGSDHLPIIFEISTAD